MIMSPDPNILMMIDMGVMDTATFQLLEAVGDIQCYCLN